MIKYTLDLNEVTPLTRLQIEHLAHLAGDFESHVLFEHQNRVINGKSMLGLLSLGMTGHDQVIMTVEGADEEEAAREIKKLLDSGVRSPKNAADAQALMQRVKKRYSDILQENLAGIYLHGSLAAGCFQWARSDIDFLVVVKSPLAKETKRALIDALEEMAEDAPPSGFEMSVILSRYCEEPPYPMPFETHFSAGHREAYRADPMGYCERMQGTDPDLTAHILCLRAFGVTLMGPSIARTFGAVQREDAMKAILYDVNDAREKLLENPCYYVLNLCRALAYKRDGLVLNKRDGGEWALQNLDQEHQRVIQAALNAYQAGRDMSFDAGLAESFCCDALDELNAPDESNG